MKTIILGRAIQVLLMVLTIKLATTFLSPTEYGRMSLITALTALFSLGLFNPVMMFFFRRQHNWQETGRLYTYSGLYLVYVVLAAVVVASVVGFTQQYFNLVDGLATPWLVVLVGSSLLFYSVNQTFITSLNLFKHRVWFVSLTACTILFALICSLLMGKLYHFDAKYWVAGQITGQTVVTLFAMVVYFKFAKKANLPIQMKPTSNSFIDSASSLLLFAYPLVLAVCLNWLQTQSYRFIIKDDIGLDMLGLFVAGYGVSSAIIASFEAILSNYFMPEFYNAVSSNDQCSQEQAWLSYANAIVPALLLTCFFIICFAQPIMRILIGPNMQSAVEFVKWGALAESGRVLFSTYSLAAHASMKTKQLILPNTLGAALALLFVLLTKVYDHTNATNLLGVALTLGYVASTLCLWLNAKKQFHFGKVWKNCVNTLNTPGVLFITAMVLLQPWLKVENMMQALVMLTLSGSLYLLVIYRVYRHG